MDSVNQSRVLVYLNEDNKTIRYYDRVPTVGEVICLSDDDIFCVTGVFWGLSGSNGEATIFVEREDK